MKTVLSLYSTLLAVILCCLMTIGCKTLNVPKGTPAFIKKKIKEIQVEKVRNPPGSVWQYEYKGQTVYYIPAYCCDRYSELYDKEGNIICHPSGGFTGNGDGKCADFNQEKKNEKMIWKDDRK